MVSIVVDIDDTLINTNRRMQGIWRELLGCNVPLDAVEALNLEQIFMKFASQDQKTQVAKFQKRFWDILLCLEEIGIELTKLHEPISFAAETLQKWSENFTLVYLTGRTENTRDLTMKELAKFGFPTQNAQLAMFDIEDYARARGASSGPTLIDAKLRLFSEISKKHNVMKVVDDYPGYFLIYRQFSVPERIGLLRPKRHLPQDYIDKGATRVVKNWKELTDETPRST